MICSATPEVAGTRSISTVRHPAELDDVDVGVVRAVFGVAETGSVWLSEREFGVNVLGFLSQHLVVLLDPRSIVPDLHHAYRHPGFLEARYAVFMTGPSATADIEGVLVRGAQGIRTLTVVPVAAADAGSAIQAEENRMIWQQTYNPFGSMVVSTALAALPVVVMLVGLGFLHLKAHIAAGLGLLAALAVAIFAYGMPAEMAGKAAMLGGFTGLLPIGWIVLNIIFLHQLADKSGACKIQEDSIANITQDRRLQLLLIAFSYGAFFEGAAGFGTPVAVTAAILIGLGFSPLAASGLSLIANTAPVAYGALGTPIITMAKVHGYDLMALSGMVGRILPLFSLIVPFWLIWAFAGRKAMMEIWPAILVSGLSFAIPQFLVSNYIGPELVDVIAAISSMVCLVLFLRVWQPKTIWTSTSLGHREAKVGGRRTGFAAGLAPAGLPPLATAGVPLGVAGADVRPGRARISDGRFRTVASPPQPRRSSSTRATP